MRMWRLATRLYTLFHFAHLDAPKLQLIWRFRRDTPHKTQTGATMPKLFTKFQVMIVVVFDVCVCVA